MHKNIPFQSNIIFDNSLLQLTVLRDTISCLSAPEPILELDIADIIIFSDNNSNQFTDIKRDQFTLFNVLLMNYYKIKLYQYLSLAFKLIYVDVVI